MLNGWKFNVATLLLGTGVSSAMLPADELTWTDVTGKFEVKAEFLGIEEGKVHLRRTEGTEIAVPFEKLDSLSQKQARRLEEFRSPVTVVSADGPPPELPPMGDDLQWNERDASMLEDATSRFAHDQVSMYFLALEMLYEHVTPRGPNEAAWLQQVLRACRSRVMSVVRADFERAIAQGDLRSALITSMVAGKIHPGGIEGDQKKLGNLKEQLLADDPPAQRTWKLQDVSATALEAKYSHDVGFGRFYTIEADEGYRLIEVEAKVTNIDDRSDLPYARWAFQRLKGFLLDPTDMDRKSRIAVDEFVFLVTPGGEWIDCTVVCSGKMCSFQSQILGDDGTVIAVIPAAERIEQGETFNCTF